jgi:hypothetical protein
VLLYPSDPVLNYDLFDDWYVTAPPTLQTVFLADSIREVDAAYGVHSESVSTSSEVIDGYIGFRYAVLKRLELTAGFRVTRYNDVGRQLRPQVEFAGLDENGEVEMNIVDVTSESTSATYEGFYGGVVVRLY